LTNFKQLIFIFNRSDHRICINSLHTTCVDLANLVNIAAIKAAVDGADKLNTDQLEFAKDRIIMGTERKTMFITEQSKKVDNILLLLF
jgi:hypothetical protein